MRSPVSLRFGHARGLTAHWAVIQYPRAASLPYGFRLRPAAVILERSEESRQGFAQDDRGDEPSPLEKVAFAKPCAKQMTDEESKTFALIEVRTKNHHRLSSAPRPITRARSFSKGEANTRRNH